MTYIEHALSFAKHFLKIKYKNFIYAYEIKPYSENDRFNGYYYLGMMVFNGYPSINTIFHEAAHYKQVELGRDLEIEFFDFKERMFDIFIAETSSLESARYLLYYNTPCEIEARNTADQLEKTYLNK